MKDVNIRSNLITHLKYNFNEFLRFNSIILKKLKHFPIFNIYIFFPSFISSYICNTILIFHIIQYISLTYKVRMQHYDTISLTTVHLHFEKQKNTIELSLISKLYLILIWLVLGSIQMMQIYIFNSQQMWNFGRWCKCNL